MSRIAQGIWWNLGYRQHKSCTTDNHIHLYMYFRWHVCLCSYLTMTYLNMPTVQINHVHIPSLKLNKNKNVYSPFKKNTRIFWRGEKAISFLGIWPYFFSWQKNSLAFVSINAPRRWFVPNLRSFRRSTWTKCQHPGVIPNFFRN